MKKSFLSEYKIRIIIALFVFGIIGGMWINFEFQLAKRDEIIEQAKIDLFNHLKSDSLARIEYANRNAKLDGLYLIQKKETVKWKDLYFEILNAPQETIKETGQIKVSFRKENKCMGVEGYTLTATEALPSYSVVKIYSFPVKVERSYIEIGEKVVEIITPKNDCIEFKNTQLDAPSWINKAYKEQKRWFGYGIGINATILDKNNDENLFELKNFGISGGFRFWNIGAILSTDFESAKINLIYWRW